MKASRLALALFLSVATSSLAAEKNHEADADLAARSAQIEMLRLKAASRPSVTTSSTLIEVDDLLHQLRRAPLDKRNALRSQLDAALARLETEIDMAGR